MCARVCARSVRAPEQMLLQGEPALQAGQVHSEPLEAVEQGVLGVLMEHCCRQQQQRQGEAVASRPCSSLTEGDQAMACEGEVKGERPLRYTEGEAGPISGPSPSAPPPPSGVGDRYTPEAPNTPALTVVERSACEGGSACEGASR